MQRIWAWISGSYFVTRFDCCGLELKLRPCHDPVKYTTGYTGRDDYWGIRQVEVNVPSHCPLCGRHYSGRGY